MVLVMKDGSFVYKTMKDGKYYLLKDTDKTIYIHKDIVLQYIKSHVISNAIIIGNSTIKPIHPTITVRKIQNKDKDAILNYFKVYKNHLKESNLNDYEYYDCMEGYYFIIENLEKETQWQKIKEVWYLGLYGNSYYCLFTSTNVFKNIIFDVTYFPLSKTLKKEKNIKFLKLLSEKVPNSIFHFEYYDTIEIPPTFKPIKYYGKYAGEGYDAKGLSLYHGSYFTEYSENALLDSFEKQFFVKEVDVKNLVIKDMSAKEITKWVQNFYKLTNYMISPFWKRDSGMSSIYGFHYFKDHDEIEGVKTLVAMQNNRFIGVIHYGVWNNNKYQSISYIDVAEPYKKKGVATKLIKELNKHLIPDMPLVLTDLSEEGKEAKMDELFKKYITVCKVYTYDEALRGYKNF